MEKVQRLIEQVTILERAKDAAHERVDDMSGGAHEHVLDFKDNDVIKIDGLDESYTVTANGSNIVISQEVEVVQVITFSGLDKTTLDALVVQINTAAG